MADPPALRMRRSRLHRRGDHSLCRDCDGLEVKVGDGPPIPAGRIADAVTDFVARLSFAEGDPRGIMTVMAVAAGQSLDESFSPGVAKELASILGNISEDPNSEPDVLDELRMKRHARGLQQVLERMSNPATHLGPPLSGPLLLGGRPEHALEVGAGGHRPLVALPPGQACLAHPDGRPDVLAAAGEPRQFRMLEAGGVSPELGAAVDEHVEQGALVADLVAVAAGVLGEISHPGRCRAVGVALTA